MEGGTDYHGTASHVSQEEHMVYQEWVWSIVEGGGEEEVIYSNILDSNAYHLPLYVYVYM